MDAVRRWWPLLAMLGLAFNLRPVAVSIGPVLTEISRDVGLSGPATGILTSLPTICFAAFGALAPAIARRVGSHAAIAMALVVLLVGQAGRLLVSHPLLFLGFSTLALSGMALANVLLPSLVREHYPNRVGTVTALYSLTMTVGVTLASSVTVPLAQALGGWRAALTAGVLTAAVALAFWIPLVRSAARRRRGTLQRITLSQIARTPLGWALAIFFGCQSAQAYTIFGWLPSVYRDAGLDHVEAGFMLGIATGVGLVPAFAIPAFVARMRNPSGLLLAILACLAGGYIGLMTAPATTPWLWALLLALGTASFPLLLALFTLRAHTPAATAALSGFAQSVGYLIATLGPLTFGLLHTTFGGWTPAIGVQLGLIAPMLVAGLYSCRPRFIEDQLGIARQA